MLHRIVEKWGKGKKEARWGGPWRVNRLKRCGRRLQVETAKESERDARTAGPTAHINRLYKFPLHCKWLCVYSDIAKGTEIEDAYIRLRTPDIKFRSRCIALNRDCSLERNPVP
jgi:hypothetical protein